MPSRTEQWMNERIKKKRVTARQKWGGGGGGGLLKMRDNTEKQGKILHLIYSTFRRNLATHYGSEM